MKNIVESMNSIMSLLTGVVIFGFLIGLIQGAGAVQ